MYTVYILYSTSFDKYYIGQTNEITRRLKQHNEGEKLRYTSKYRPWVLSAQIDVPTRSIALKVERFIKKQKSKAFIKRLIDEPSLFQQIVERCSAG